MGRRGWGMLRCGGQRLPLLGRFPLTVWWGAPMFDQACRAVIEPVLGLVAVSRAAGDRAGRAWPPLDRVGPGCGPTGSGPQCGPAPNSGVNRRLDALTNPPAQTWLGLKSRLCALSRTGGQPFCFEGRLNRGKIEKRPTADRLSLALALSHAFLSLTLSLTQIPHTLSLSLTPRREIRARQHADRGEESVPSPPPPTTKCREGVEALP